MTVRAILWTYEPRKNGTCNIKIYVNDGKKKYFKTKLSVLPQDFDAQKGLVKKSHPSYLQYNAIIRNKIREIENHLLSGGDFSMIGKKPQHDLILFLERFVADTKAGLTEVSIGTGRNYNSLLTRLKQYCNYKNQTTLTFDDIDLNFYEDFKRFLLEKANCKLSGFGKHIKILKTTMRIALDAGLHSNEVFRHKLFKKITVKTNKIYLTEAEIQKLDGSTTQDKDTKLEK